MKVQAQNMGRLCCVQNFFLKFRTISVHNMFSPCSAKRRASEKDLPVPVTRTFFKLFPVGISDEQEKSHLATAQPYSLFVLQSRDRHSSGVVVTGKWQSISRCYEEFFDPTYVIDVLFSKTFRRGALVPTYYRCLSHQT